MLRHAVNVAKVPLQEPEISARSCLHTSNRIYRPVHRCCYEGAHWQVDPSLAVKLLITGELISDSPQTTIDRHRPGGEAQNLGPSCRLLWVHMAALRQRHRDPRIESSWAGFHNSSYWPCIICQAAVRHTMLVRQHRQQACEPMMAWLKHE